MESMRVILGRLGAAAGAGLLLYGLLHAACAGATPSLTAAIGASLLVFFWHPLPSGKGRDGKPQS